MPALLKLAGHSRAFCYLRHPNYGMKKLLLLTLSTAFFCVLALAQTDTAKSRYVKVDDVKIHYKIYGKGDPLLLLHGSLESLDDWAKQIPEFSKRFQVIAIDNRGHGRSTFTDKKMDYILLSEDVVAVMQELKIDSAHIIGFGDGGIIGLYLAINHPARVRKLVAIGANYKVDTTAVYSQILDKVKAWDDDKMFQFVRNNFKGYQNYDQITQFTHRMKTMLLTEPNLTPADLQKIKCSVLLMNGDHDIIKLSHTAEIFENIPGCYLSVIPGAKHYPQKEKPLLVNPTILDFLNKRFAKLSRF